jgi:hypothetical protein
LTEIEKNLATLAEQINVEHRACESAATAAVEHAMNAGEHLAAVKVSLAHGEFLPWLSANFEGSRRTASTYIRLFDNRDALNEKRASHSIRGALAELSAPEKPQEEPTRTDGLQGMPRAYYISREETERVQAQLKRLDIFGSEGNLPTVKEGTTPDELELGFKLLEAIIEQGEVQKGMIARAVGVSREELDERVTERLSNMKSA